MFGGGFASAPFAASAPPAAPHAPVQWYFYLQRDPRGMPDGWYEYDAHINLTVEQLFQSSQNAPPTATGHNKRRHVLNMVASSGYQYELDFQRMTQRNITSGKERPIHRTTNGQPPTMPPASARGAAPAPSAPVAPHYAAPNPAPAAFGTFSFGAPPAVVARRAAASASASTPGQTLQYTAPERLHEVKMDESKVFVDVPAPDSKPKAKDDNDNDEDNDDEEEKKNEGSSYSKGGAHDDDCVICLDNLWGSSEKVVAIKSCEHRFHYGCIHEALTKGGGKCPLCSKSIVQEEGDSQTSKGKCPSGTMMVRSRPSQNCGGYPGVGTLEISYRIPSGTQKDYHPQPGFGFSGANRTAYLPDNQEGQDLLARMQFGFMHGLSFMVGTSLTTGQANTVTWASIHHKTSMRGGTYGFPDPTYFNRANDEMNQLGIPSPAACRIWLQNNCPGYGP